MLWRYCNRVGGQVYAEVPLAGPKGPALWSSNSTTRRLDGVRFAAPDRHRQVRPFDKRAFVASLSSSGTPWLIEAKVKLNRPVIGQIIVGADLFEKQYGVKPAKLIILCRTGDDALEWACKKRGIEVEKDC